MAILKKTLFCEKIHSWAKFWGSIIFFIALLIIIGLLGNHLTPFEEKVGGITPKDG